MSALHSSFTSRKNRTTYYKLTTRGSFGEYRRQHQSFSFFHVDIEKWRISHDLAVHYMQFYSLNDMFLSVNQEAAVAIWKSPPHFTTTTGLNSGFRYPLLMSKQHSE